MVRIVKLTFNPTKIDMFLEIFNKTKVQIRNFEGCRLLELYNDKKNPTIFFSYSYWDDEKHLEAYRNSEFFKSIWVTIKPLFSEKPEAWSVDKLESLT